MRIGQTRPVQQPVDGRLGFEATSFDRAGPWRGRTGIRRVGPRSVRHVRPMSSVPTTRLTTSGPPRCPWSRPAWPCPCPPARNWTVGSTTTMASSKTPSQGPAEVLHPRRVCRGARREPYWERMSPRAAEKRRLGTEASATGTPDGAHEQENGRRRDRRQPVVDNVGGIRVEPEASRRYQFTGRAPSLFLHVVAGFSDGNRPRPRSLASTRGPGPRLRCSSPSTASPSSPCRPRRPARTAVIVVLPTPPLPRQRCGASGRRTAHSWGRFRGDRGRCRTSPTTR